MLLKIERTPAPPPPLPASFWVKMENDRLLAQLS